MKRAYVAPELIQLKIENIHEITKGITAQGRETRRSIWCGGLNADPDLNPSPVLRPIPIRGRLVAKAIGTLMSWGIFKDDGHSMSILQIRKDMLEDFGESTIQALVDEEDAERDDVILVIKELAAMLEMQFTSETIRDGDYFALYWKDGWSQAGGTRECSHVHLNTKDKDGLVFCEQCGTVMSEKSKQKLPIRTIIVQTWLIDVVRKVLDSMGYEDTMFAIDSDRRVIIIKDFRGNSGKVMTIQALIACRLSDFCREQKMPFDRWSLECDESDEVAEEDPREIDFADLGLEKEADEEGWGDRR